VLYGLGNNTPVTVDPRVVHRLLLTPGGQNQILTLEGSGLTGKYALIRDYQVDPVQRNLLHVDLLEIDVTKKITVTVKLNYVGKSEGVAEGGVLNYIERSIDVKCLPISIPAAIDVDVTALKIGDSIHLDELKLPEGIEKASQSNPTLITVVPPTKVEGEEGAAAAPAAGGEKKAEKKDEKKK
jgi:large subunit ribosomal protein L25